MHTAAMPQAAPSSHGAQTYRQQRIAQTGQLPASLRFHQLIPPSAPAAVPPPPHPGASGHTISIDVRIGTSAARSFALRNGLEHSYSLGVGVPHNRSSAHSVITSLAALPASIPAAPTGENSKEQALKALPPLENVADDPSLHNPLARLERLGTGWFGVRSDPSSYGLHCIVSSLAWQPTSASKAILRRGGQLMQQGCPQAACIGNKSMSAEPTLPK